MKKKMRKWIALMAGVIFLGSGAMVGYQHYQYHLGEQAYTEAEELAGIGVEVSFDEEGNPIQ